MDPLTAIGAVASAAQLFDMSLDYSNRACKFIAAFNKAEEHATLLQQKLQQVNLLMRELQRYIDRSRPSATDASEHPPLLYSIVEISRQFADDMICLHNLLPYDMTAFSASIRKRARFVLKEKDAENVVRRLESCKSAAIVALELIGRLNDESAGRQLKTLQQQMQKISSQQNGLAQRITRHHEALATQFHPQDSHLLASVWEIHKLVVQNDCKAVASQRTFAESTTRRLSDMKTQIAEILSHQNSIISTQSLQVANAEAGVNDADTLARLIRLELRQQLAPLLEKMDGAREHIDRIAASFSSNAVSTGLFKTDNVDQEQTAEGYIFNCESILFLELGLALEGSLLCTHLVRITKDFKPEFIVLMQQDNLARLRLFLETGRLGIWDVNENGSSLLEIALIFAAPSIVQFLLRDSGYGARLVESYGITIGRTSDYITSFVLTVGQSKARDVLVCLTDFSPDPTDELSNKNSFRGGWSNFYGDVKHLLHTKEAMDEVVSASHLLIEFGHTLQPFGGIELHNLEETIFLMEIYLITGGNPKGFVSNGDTIIFFALQLIAEIFTEDSGTKDNEDGDDDDAENYHEFESNRDCEDHCWTQRELSVILLVMLLSTGAYCGGTIICSEDYRTHSFTLSQFAFEHGILDIWNDALIKCGYDPLAVCLAENSHSVAARKLCGADRTGVV
ncbi:hypothetical protein NQ176_g3478 [Zarea fungicola]|uniref:Uncharacterized protein n=1 Tax=Zarea fungicola TaxID=93591 RepID=A0ACC1NJF9_9HYPO|nr:hypothetical protein NQ176_g3478 [Lecanicillium fungicola]